MGKCLSQGHTDSLQHYPGLQTSNTVILVAFKVVLSYLGFPPVANLQWKENQL